VKDSLRAATDAAAACGVIGVPTVLVGETAYWGDDRLEEAAGVARRSGL
jgi:2-hydroxychromene-2-carboxylate isomerase